MTEEDRHIEAYTKDIKVGFWEVRKPSQCAAAFT